MSAPAADPGSGAPDPTLFLSSSTEALPEPIELHMDEPVVEFWRRRIAQHLTEYYAGIRLSKFPEDLRVLEQRSNRGAFPFVGRDLPREGLIDMHAVHDSCLLLRERGRAGSHEHGQRSRDETLHLHQCSFPGWTLHFLIGRGTARRIIGPPPRGGQAPELRDTRQPCRPSRIGRVHALDPHFRPEVADWSPRRVR